MAVSLGLKFDTSPWGKGVKNAASLVKKGLSGTILSPFDKAVKRSVRGMKKLFGGVGNFIKGALSSALAPLIALFAVAKILGGIKSALTESLAAYREYSDSVTTLQAALRSVGETDVSGATNSVKELGNQLRLSLGIMASDTNKSFSTFLTRGFDTSQARQLTILAANYAKKSGKPLADVTKMVSDAAVGNVDAMKELGVQIDATGNKVRDGEAAVLALKNAYGDIGGDLANPSERLAAAWNALAISLGERISPVLEPIIQGFSDFVTGLTQTEEGKVMLDGIADTLKGILDWTVWLLKGASNLTQGLIAEGGVIKAFLTELFNDLMAMIVDNLRSLPGGDFLLEKLGFDPEFAAKGFREGAVAASEELALAMEDMKTAQANLLNGTSDTGLFGAYNKIKQAGTQAREEATKSLSDEMARTKGDTFAGKSAHDDQAAKDKAAREAALKKNNQRVTGYASANAGQRVSVSLLSTRPDRFRKARA